MSPTARRPTSGRAKASPPQGKRGAVKRRPIGAPEPRVSPEQAVARTEELAALYRPLLEAAEAEVSKTKSGRALLENARVLGAELGELYEAIASGKTPFEDGHRLARRRRNEFRERYEGRIFEAYAPHVRLQPSVEAIAQILAPELPLKTKWVAETAAPGSMLLTPKIDPDDLGTAGQGLDDPMGPQPVRSCLGPPYPLQDEGTAYGLTAFALSGTLPNTGKLFADGNTWTTPLTPVAVATASAWVGQDFEVPAGIRDYKVTVDYDYHFFGTTIGPWGLGTVSTNLGVLIDKGDGDPPLRNTHNLHFATGSFWGGGFNPHGSETVTDPIIRSGSSTQPEPSNGTVRVWVGIDSHCVSIGIFTTSNFQSDVTVKSICVNSAV
jgi:hypothetical protein